MEENARLLSQPPEKELSLNEFEDAYGERIADALNLDSWPLGDNMQQIYSKLEEEVRLAVQDEDRICASIRQNVFPEIEKRKRIECAGLHCFDEKMIEKAHKGFLFNGAVEACDGTSVVHDTIPLTITQIGVCLVSYNGQNGSYVHRLYRRDLRLKGDDPVKEALEMLDRRSRRTSVGVEDKSEKLSDLARRGIMTYAERAILLEKSSANWRMGHGNPAPYELMTGFWAHHEEMVNKAIAVMTGVVEHKRFVFVPSAPRDRHLITLGNALRPMEYLVLNTLEDDLLLRLDSGGYRGYAKEKVKAFVHEIGPQIGVGLYRVSSAAPPSLFYGHVDHMQTAALVAMADSILQFHRGFPMLIDLADHLCRSNFGQADFIASVQQAYAETGSPTRFLGERETRIK